MSLLAAFGRVLLGLSGALAAGAAVSRAFTGGLTRRERAAWSLAAGLLVQSGCLLFLLMLGATPRATSLLLTEAGVAAAAWMLSPPKERPASESPVSAPWQRALVGSLALVAAAAWLVFLVGAVSDSMWATDYLAFWGYKGKMIFLSSGVPRRLFEDPSLYFAHREYPLLVPFSLAALASFVGDWNDQALALFYPACELATLLALSGFLERRVSRLAGAVGATLASLCFFLYRPGNAGTAEVPFALGLVLVGCGVVDCLRRDERSSIARLAVASLFCAYLKQEGTLFAVLAAAALWWSSRHAPKGPRRTAVAALIAPPIVQWALLYLLRGNQTRRDFDFTLFEPGRLSELPALFTLVVGRMLSIGARDALAPLCAIALYLLVTRHGIADPLRPVFGAQLLCYAIAFSVSSFDPLYAIEGAFRRIVMSLFPAFTLVLGSRCPPQSPMTQTGRPPAVSPPKPEGIRSWPSTEDLSQKSGGTTG